MKYLRTDKQKFLALAVVAIIVTTFFPELIGLGVPHVFASGSTSNDTILGDILFTILKPFHLLAGTAGSLMGVSAYYTVVDMGTLVGKVQPVVIAAWKLLRDIGNLLLVFGFMMIGIATILDSASYGAKKALPKLLIVAVMLNFSLFAAEFIVDTGNMFATQFYKQMNGGTIPTTFNPSSEPISTAIMNNLGLTTIYNSATGKVNAPAKMDAMTRVLLFFLAIILFTVLAFVLGSIAIMLAARFVVLLFLLIVSPIGFIGLAGIPVVSKYGRRWWGAITNQTVFAPILFLFLLIVTKFANMGALIGGAQGGYAAAANAAATNAGSGSLAAIILGFVITTGLLIASLIISKSLAGKTSGLGTRGFGKVMFGGAALANRYTLGLGANKLVNSSRFKNSRIARMPIMGRGVTAGLNRMATGSFDTRNGGITGRILKAGGVDAGPAGGKDGYRKSYEDAVKGREAHAKYLATPTLDEKEKQAAAGQARKEQEQLARQHKEERENTEKRHQSELVDHDIAVENAQSAVTEAQKAVADLENEKSNAALPETRAKYDEDIARAKKTLEDNEKLLERENGLRKDKVAAQEAELKGINRLHRDEMRPVEYAAKRAEGTKKAIDNRVKKRAQAYADNIANAGFSVRGRRVNVGGAFATNREARLNIQKTLNKDPSQAQIDALMEQLKKSSESKSEEK